VNFFKNLFGGGKGVQTADADGGLYYFVQPDGCDEIVRVRVNPHNDLSQHDDEDGFFVRKLARGERCRQAVTLEIRYDARRRYASHQVEGGRWATADEYAAWQAAKPSA
jgi:hypothetical protein